MNKIIVKDKKELKELIQQEMKDKGNNCDLNHIDTSLIKGMSNLFDSSPFDGNISGWDVSNVEDMALMFANSLFNGDISTWNTSKVKSMNLMFYESLFNTHISTWDVSKVKAMGCMFYDSKFNQDISNWKINEVEEIENMFSGCECPKPWWYIEDNEARKEALDKFALMEKIANNLPNKSNQIKKPKL